MPKPQGHIGEWTVADEAKQKLANKPPETPPETPETPEIPEVKPETPEPVDIQTITPEQISPTPEVEIEPERPYQGLTEVFGPEWKPAPVFEQLGLTEQQIYGAVRVKGMDDVYTIGEGGRKETAESYLERFGTAEQAGIVGEVSMEEAKKLGINIEADALLSELGNDLFVTPEMTPEEKTATITDIFSTYDEKYGIEELRKQKNETTQTLIDSISGMAEEFKEMKAEERERLGLEAKSKAIVDAQKAHSDLLNVYTKYINDLNYSTMTSAHISGAQSKARSQAAVELAPLAMAISIAGDDYNRAAEQLSEYMNDWQMGMEWSLNAAQMQIDLLGENLSESQEKSRTEAQTHLNFVLEDYEQKKADQEQIKQLMMAYNGLGAGVNIDDSFSDAMKKISPYMESEVAMEKRLKEIGLESAEIGLLIDKKNLAGGNGGYAPSALKKLWTELGGLEGTGMSINEFYESEKGKGDEGIITFQSALEDTANYLIGLRDAGKLSDMNYSQAVGGFMADFGLEDKEQVESAINNIMSGGTLAIQEEVNVGSDFDYTPLVFKSGEAAAKSRADLPHDAKLIYDKLKKENPYSSAAFLIRETLKSVGLSK